jgi:hypothetical protein
MARHRDRSRVEAVPLGARRLCGDEVEPVLDAGRRADVRVPRL